MPQKFPIVPDALSHPPFEPLQQAELKILSFMTALLLALVSAKFIIEISAFYPPPFSSGSRKV